MNSDSEISKKEQLQPTPISLGEKIETLIADLVGLLVRYARTVVVFSLMPVRAALTLCLQPIDYRKILRPFTFLLFGCMLFSFLLGASTYFDKSKFTTYVLEIVKNRLVEFSFTGLLVRSIPLVIITSLFATFASVLSRTSGEILKMLLAYLYGLQGNLIFIFVLAMPPLGDAFQALGRPDDDLIPTFFLLILALGVQGFRVFRLVINATEERFKVRVLLILFFPIFFLAPLPLTGYVVMKTGLIQDEVKLESPESRLAPVRIIEAKDTKIEQNSVHMILTALVHNQSKLPFILTQSEIHLELYLVLSIDLNNTEFWQLDRRTLPYLDCFDLNILSIKRMQAIFRNPKEIPFVILPEAAKMIKVKIEAEGSSAYFRKRKVWDNEGQLIHQSVKKIDKPWDELAEDRSLIFRLILLDPTSNKELVSDYFRVQRTKKKTRAIRIP